MKTEQELAPEPGLSDLKEYGVPRLRSRSSMPNRQIIDATEGRIKWPKDEARKATAFCSDCAKRVQLRSSDSDWEHLTRLFASKPHAFCIPKNRDNKWRNLPVGENC